MHGNQSFEKVGRKVRDFTEEQRKQQERKRLHRHRAVTTRRKRKDYEQWAKVFVHEA